MKKDYIKVLKYIDLCKERKSFTSAMEIQLHCQERMACVSVKTTDVYIYYVKNLYSTDERLKKKKTLHITETKGESIQQALM